MKRKNMTLFITQFFSSQLLVLLSYGKIFYSTLEVISRHFNGCTEEDHEKPQDSLRPSRFFR
jgi:hypothetical protein